MAGDWFEIKERLHRPDELYNFLLPRDDPRREERLGVVAAIVHELDTAVEAGVFEVRRREIAETLSEIAEAEYSSEVFARLEELSDRMMALTLVGVLQRALLTGEIAFEVETGEAEPSGSSKKDIENAELNEIIQDIKEIVANDPSAKMNAAIKNVLLQLQKYREEAATYKKLKEQATDYRLEMYSKTFAATFKQIFESIRKNYAAYLEEQETKRREAIPSPIDGLELRPWVRMITADLEGVSRVRSTLAFATEERGGMRGFLVALGKDKDTHVARIDQERAVAKTACGSDAATAKLSRILSVEIAAWLRKRGEE